LLERYGGDLELALAATMPGRARWTGTKGVLPYRGTQGYVRAVMDGYRKELAR
jgi:hypothetical protein